MKRNKFLAGLLSVCLLFGSLPVMAAEPECRIDMEAESGYALENEEGEAAVAGEDDNAKEEGTADKSAENEDKLTEGDNAADEDDGAAEGVSDSGNGSGEAALDEENDSKDEGRVEDGTEGTVEDKTMADEGAEEDASMEDESTDAGERKDSELDVNDSVSVDVEINADNFSDEVFREYVSENFDTDMDGVLSGKEIVSVKNIDVKYSGIESLKGIEYFAKLLYIDCSYNSL